MKSMALRLSHVVYGRGDFAYVVEWHFCHPPALLVAGFVVFPIVPDSRLAGLRVVTLDGPRPCNSLTSS